MSVALSYSSGESATPLLGDTIGGNFDATVRAFGDREALVDRPAGRRWTYAELAADVEALALGLLGLSRHHETVDMMPYMISGAVGGTFCLGLGATLTATATLRANWSSLDRLDQLFDVEGR